MTNDMMTLRASTQTLSQRETAHPTAKGEGDRAPTETVAVSASASAASHHRGDQGTGAGDPGLVQLLPARRVQAHFQRLGQLRLDHRLQVGKTPPPEQEPKLGRPSILRHR